MTYNLCHIMGFVPKAGPRSFTSSGGVRKGKIAALHPIMGNSQTQPLGMLRQPDEN